MTSLGLVWGKSEIAQVRIHLVQKCVHLLPSPSVVVMNLTPFFSQQKPTNSSHFTGQKEGKIHFPLNWNESVNCFKGRATGLCLSLYPLSLSQCLELGRHFKNIYEAENITRLLIKLQIVPLPLLSHFYIGRNIRPTACETALLLVGVSSLCWANLHEDKNYKLWTKPTENPSYLKALESE